MKWCARAAWRECVEGLGAEEQFAYWLELVEQVAGGARESMLRDMAGELARRAPLDGRAAAWLARVRQRLEAS